MDIIQKKILNINEFYRNYNKPHFYVKCFKDDEWVIIKFYKTLIGWNDQYIDSSWKGQYLLKKYLGNQYIQLTNNSINVTYHAIKDWLECDFDSVNIFNYIF